MAAVGTCCPAAMEKQEGWAKLIFRSGQALCGGGSYPRAQAEQLTEQDGTSVIVGRSGGKGYQSLIPKLRENIFNISPDLFSSCF